MPNYCRSRGRIVLAGMVCLFSIGRQRAQILRADAPLPSFEVATIKPSAGAPPPGSEPRGANRLAADEVRMFATTQLLIRFAFNVQALSKAQIVGGPDWVNDDLYEIRAKISGPLSEAMQTMPGKQRQEKTALMEQSLLADRFKLKVHFETRELPEFALVVAKGGSKLTPSTVDAGAPGLGIRLAGQDLELKGTGTSIQGLTSALQMQPELGGRLLVDRTDLTGKYDMTLNWARDRGAAPLDPGTAPDAPTLFAAIEEQLGLKLVEIKGPVVVIVIDHIERPSENYG